MPFTARGGQALDGSIAHTTGAPPPRHAPDQSRKHPSDAKKTLLKPWREVMWCMGKLTKEYRKRMYDVHDLYARPYRERKPVQGEGEGVAASLPQVGMGAARNAACGVALAHDAAATTMARMGLEVSRVAATVEPLGSMHRSNAIVSIARPDTSDQSGWRMSESSLPADATSDRVGLSVLFPSAASAAPAQAVAAKSMSDTELSGDDASWLAPIIEKLLSRRTGVERLDDLLSPFSQALAREVMVGPESVCAVSSGFDAEATSDALHDQGAGHLVGVTQRWVDFESIVFGPPQGRSMMTRSTGPQPTPDARMADTVTFG